MNISVKKIEKGLSGIIEIPSDKSISHRAVIFSGLAKGKSIIKNFSCAKDPLSSLEVMKSLGVDIIFNSSGEVVINSSGVLKKPNKALDCGNSGTTMRLLAGILARQDFNSILVGDESLSNRPMKRIIEPLSKMGAIIKSNNDKAPLSIFGSKLSPITYYSSLSSAQVKSCVLLAGLGIEGVTTFSEPFLSRNHTEIMLKSMGANIEYNEGLVKIEKSELNPINIEICGDISSAAYFIVAALIIPNSSIILKNVGLNPTRCGILDVVKSMGGNVEILDKRYACSEPVGDIKIEYSQLKGCNISGDVIPRLIDEIPVIAVMATQAEGDTIISDAQDLRNKESDRIKAIVNELNKLGANIEENPDGMIIHGKTPLKGGVELDTYNDHRLAMSLYLAGLICSKEVLIRDFEWVNISFPTFIELFEKLSLQ